MIRAGQLAPIPVAASGRMEGAGPADTRPSRGVDLDPDCSLTPILDDKSIIPAAFVVAPVVVLVLDLPLRPRGLLRRLTIRPSSPPRREVMPCDHG